MELTEKKFEQILDRKLDKKLANFTTKDDLKQQTKELKDFVKAERNDLVVMIQDTIVEPMDRRFDRLETKLDRHIVKPIVMNRLSKR